MSSSAELGGLGCLVMLGVAVVAGLLFAASGSGLAIVLGVVGVIVGLVVLSAFVK